VYTYDHYGTLIGSHTLAVTSNKIVCHSDDWKCPKSSSVPAGFGLRYCNAAYCPHSGLARNRLSAEIRRSCRRTVTLIVCNLKHRYRSGKKAVCFKSSLPQVFVTRNNEYTLGDSYVISMPAGFRRHLVGKTLRNVFHCDITEIRFVGKLMIMRTFS